MIESRVMITSGWDETEKHSLENSDTEKKESLVLSILRHMTELQ